LRYVKYLGGITHREQRDQEVVDLSVFQTPLLGFRERGSGGISDDLEIVSKADKGIHENIQYHLGSSGEAWPFRCFPKIRD